MRRLLVIFCLLTTVALAQPDRVFRDEAFNFEFLRVLGASPYRCADVEECYLAAAGIREGDFESWYASWFGLAERIRGIGDRAAAAGHRVSAREAWLRAGNYYRSAEFYLHGNPADPRILETWGKSRECFLKAGVAEPVEIPYEGSSLPGYFYSAGAGRRPLVLIQTGFDGTQEELYPQAIAAVERGYHALTFEGPGQGAPLREQHLFFRPDWEKVITPVVDYAVTRSDVDAGKLALMGISLGGYLAPRGAAYEPRISALIANGGVYWPVEPSLQPLYGVEGLPADASALLDFIRANPNVYNNLMAEEAQRSTSVRWFVEHGMFAFNASSPAELVLAYSEMTMKDAAARIQCPTLVVLSEGDKLMGDQPQKLYDALTCPKTLMRFTAAEGAQAHCQIGAVLLSNQRIYDWLDVQLR